MHIDSTYEHLPWESDEPTVQVFDVSGFPAGHPAEPGLFVRQEGMPGHDQGALDQARVVMVGAGGLGSWTGLGLVRSGIRNLTIIDPDRFDRTNAHRQFVFPEDLGRYKASSLGRNLVPHMIAGGTITAINMPFEEAVGSLDTPTDILLVLVDNNRCRQAACRWALSRSVPAVYGMLSLDGTRLHVFLQESCGACLWCALPNLDPESRTPCANASIVGCLVVAGNILLLAHRVLMRCPSGTRAFNWIEDDIKEPTQGGFGMVPKRNGCRVCAR
jgi:molybdopterin-synthase adenylyltransferase